MGALGLRFGGFGVWGQGHLGFEFRLEKFRLKVKGIRLGFLAQGFRIM